MVLDINEIEPILLTLEQRVREIEEVLIRIGLINLEELEKEAKGIQTEKTEEQPEETPEETTTETKQETTKEPELPTWEDEKQ